MTLHIKRHLLAVVDSLSTNESGLHRKRLLRELRAYAQRGRFPSWESQIRGRERARRPRRFTGPGRRAPRFRDHNGTWCAVGHLIALTDPVLADDIARTFEDRWLGEMRDPRLAEWAHTHGFTLDELAWIQPSYCWQPPMCDEMPAYEISYTADVPSCDGADPQLTYGQFNWFCQDGCSGPFRVFLQVENHGASVATGVTARLWAPEGWNINILDSQIIDIEPLSAVVVELQAPNVLAVADGGVQILRPGSCTPGPRQQMHWERVNGGPGWVLPDECGMTCAQDTGEPPPEPDPPPDHLTRPGGVSSTPDEAPVEPREACGCSNPPSTPTSWRWPTFARRRER